MDSQILWADGNAVLDVVEHVLRHDVLGHQLTLHFVGAIAHDSVGHILSDAQESTRSADGALLILSTDNVGAASEGAPNTDGDGADLVGDEPEPVEGVVKAEAPGFDDSDRERSFISF